ncbi:hypothetical protein DM01DRAFT_1411575 [Hesseltinella vesiculosa]|uniref:Suppressor of white apricot N-terminal domain-containing protein n=1 Tax=Hesseltinella vesiculosa TaxID=101127 RepID=A0A1X2G3A1_9FUNG|nr:hypothetical protein DM01DRAFT_1411575 [Hesseltinella vesiculosa]
MDKRKNRKESTPDMLLFGYQSKLFKDNIMAEKIELGHGLIPWKSHDRALLMDRFDARHILEDLDELRNNSLILDLQDELAEDRFGDIADELHVYGMSSAEERQDYAEEKRRKRLQTSGGPRKRFQYCYNAHPVPRTETQKDIAKKYSIDESMVVPKSQQELERIEETAKDLASKSRATGTSINVQEIYFQVRHVRDPDVVFVNKQHPLYPFYRHVLHIFKEKIPNASSPKTLSQYTQSSSVVALVADYSSSDEEGSVDVRVQNDTVSPERFLVERITSTTARPVAKAGSRDSEISGRRPKLHVPVSSTQASLKAATSLASYSSSTPKTK